MSPAATDGMLKVAGGFWGTQLLIKITLINSKEIINFIFIELPLASLPTYITSFRTKSYLLTALNLLSFGLVRSSV